MQMKKTLEFTYGFKSHFTSINERFYKVEVCLRSIRKNNIKTFPPFGNELLPPSKNIYLTSCPIMYPLNGSIYMIMIIDVSCKLV